MARMAAHTASIHNVAADRSNSRFALQLWLQQLPEQLQFLGYDPQGRVRHTATLRWDLPCNP
jgi:hypothetical protein